MGQVALAGKPDLKGILFTVTHSETKRLNEEDCASHRPVRRTRRRGSYADPIGNRRAAKGSRHSPRPWLAAHRRPEGPFDGTFAAGHVATSASPYPRGSISIDSRWRSAELRGRCGFRWSPSPIPHPDEAEAGGCNASSDSYDGR